MSEATPTRLQTTPVAEPGATCWYVRAACEQDVPALAAAVGELLLELGGTPPDVHAMETTARSLVDDCDSGVVLVAEADGEIVGLLAASWQTAIHIPGRYALIQDLWVERSWRSRAIGGELLTALCELVGERQIARIEVGLPRESFAGLAATEAFYRANDFTPLGPRMRKLLG